jgi:hypothetical protein
LKNEKMLRGYARPRPAASQDGGKVGFFKKKLPPKPMVSRILFYEKALAAIEDRIEI